MSSSIGEREREKMDSPLERRIKTYAFTHQCDLDTASYKVLRDITSEITQNRKTEGLYDSLFGGQDGKTEEN